MQTSLVVLVLAAFVSPAVSAVGQTGAPAPAPAAAAVPTAPVKASALLQPSLDVVTNTLNSLKLDKWKKGSVRQEAEQNVSSILRDIQGNLPPLMGAADAAPGSLSAAMPLVKHLDAVYDVLLRVEEASRVAAPSDQIGQLQDVLTVFGTARFALDDALQKAAAMQEKQLSDLRAQLSKPAQSTAIASKASEKPCVPAAKPVHHARSRHAAPKKTTGSTPSTQKPQAGKPD